MCNFEFSFSFVCFIDDIAKVSLHRAFSLLLDPNLDGLSMNRMRFG